MYHSTEIVICLRQNIAFLQKNQYKLTVVEFAWISGLEMYTLYLSKNGLKLVEYKKAHVSWYVYTHESRLVLLASGMQCKTLSGYQVVYLSLIIYHI